MCALIIFAKLLQSGFRSPCGRLARSSLDDITASVRDLDAGLVLGGGVTLEPGVVVDGRY